MAKVLQAKEGWPDRPVLSTGQHKHSAPERVLTDLDGQGSSYVRVRDTILIILGVMCSLGRLRPLFPFFIVIVAEDTRHQF